MVVVSNNIIIVITCIGFVCWNNWRIFHISSSVKGSALLPSSLLHCNGFVGIYWQVVLSKCLLLLLLAPNIMI